MIQLNVDFLTYDKIVEESARFFSSFGADKDVPVPIEKIVEYGLGVDIVPVPGLMRTFEIDGGTACDLSIIYVDEFIYKQRPTRYRFTLAHESGHIFIHGKYIKQIDLDTYGRWQDFQDQIDQDDYDRLEFQGYAFGSLVLVSCHI